MEMASRPQRTPQPDDDKYDVSGAPAGAASTATASATATRLYRPFNCSRALCCCRSSLARSAQTARGGRTGAFGRATFRRRNSENSKQPNRRPPTRRKTTSRALTRCVRVWPGSHAFRALLLAQPRACARSDPAPQFYTHTLWCRRPTRRAASPPKAKTRSAVIALRARVVCTSATLRAMSCGSSPAPPYPLQSPPSHLRANVIVSWGRTIVRICSAQRRNANRRARKEAGEHVEDGDNEVAVAAAALQETSIAPVPQPAELSEEGKRIRCVCWSVGCAMCVVGMHVHECNLCQHISRVACARSNAHTHSLSLSLSLSLLSLSLSHKHTHTHTSTHTRSHSLTDARQESQEENQADGRTAGQSGQRQCHAICRAIGEAGVCQRLHATLLCESMVLLQVLARVSARAERASVISYSEIQRYADACPGDRHAHDLQIRAHALCLMRTHARPESTRMYPANVCACAQKHKHICTQSKRKELEDELASLENS